MSMLARYKKKGGFFQLLNLIETCGKEKQEKFLKMIEEEDLRWAEAIKGKLLTVKRIFSWDENTIAEFTATMNDLTLVTAMYGLDDASKDKIYKMMNHARKRKFEQLVAEKKPTPAEINTAFVQIITEVRKIVQDGSLSFEKIDPALVINAKYEEELLNGVAIPGASSIKLDMPEVSTVVVNSEGKGAPVQNGDSDNLKKMINHLNLENQKLKERLTAAEGKLLQIKKIA